MFIVEGGVIMKKILLFTLMVMVLSACTSTREEDTIEKMSREADAQWFQETRESERWWQEIGEPNGEDWWGSEDE